ncbi:hypothetical protein WBZ18_02425 [Clostridium botulinum]|uniref:Uncharacterized protein n=1 Tax=Clostridium botulinum TaxID=1491 RepID=A0A846I3L5_CLOBO|nr:hypothetical protein [Clostridium botulinum]AJD26463.1 hypothetical protein T257_3505 [Clostridium botulinum CDC_297]EPS47226.1 hypothetical protein CFSAN002368_25472 [Clostridium botulinum A1 str. CFSAN002368]AJE09791.1 hypothetical protein T259_2470 [Clostridium botulinum CDC_1436]APR00761.1 hypothetical protein RSJ2_1872 [Clostridium botulinum]AXG90865.1 hypothetical protein AGE29_03425 [Clostridium botulinum]
MIILETENSILKSIFLGDAQKVYSLTSYVEVKKFMRFSTHYCKDKLLLPNLHQKLLIYTLDLEKNNE